MFSSRFTYQKQKNRLVGAWEQKKKQNEPVLDLTLSNPTVAGFTYNEQAILKSLANPDSLEYHPLPKGMYSARVAVARYYAQTHNLPVDPEMLFLTASTSEAYAYLFKQLADPGDEILIPVPGYPLFDFLAELECVKHTGYRCRYDASGFHIALDMLRHTISTKTRAIVVVNPGNPTGAYLKKEEIAGLNELCNEYGLALIVDEVFLDFAGPSVSNGYFTACANDRCLTFVLSGLSKILGMPQMKLAWISVNGPEALRIEAAQRLEFIADTYLSVSSAVQGAAPGLLAEREHIQKQIVDRCNTNERHLKALLAKTASCQMLLREGGWYAIVKLPPQSNDETVAYQVLVENNLYVHPGYFYDFMERNYLVLSLLTQEEVFLKGIEILVKKVDEKKYDK